MCTLCIAFEMKCSMLCANIFIDGVRLDSEFHYVYSCRLLFRNVHMNSEQSDENEKNIDASTGERNVIIRRYATETCLLSTYIWIVKW